MSGVMVMRSLLVASAALGEAVSMTGKRLLSAYVVLMMAFLALPIAVVIPSAFSAGSALTFPPQGFSLKWFAAILERRYGLSQPEIARTIAQRDAEAMDGPSTSLYRKRPHTVDQAIRNARTVEVALFATSKTVYED